jgi:ATP-dependent helicase HrpB
VNRALLKLQLSHALPIEAILPAICDALRGSNSLVVQAPPGSGKTTLLPLALLDQPWRGEGKIIVLEPRRLAARMAARRMASLLGEKVGETVGYRVRLDSQVGPATRIEVHTDGVFLRRLQQDPELGGIAAVLFDEIHERSLETDLALALCLEARAALRPDLKLVAMSATLDAAPFATLLGQGGASVPVVTGDGRSFPVETRWRPMTPMQRLDQATADCVREAIADAAGDLLVFLPGIAEIRRVQAKLEEGGLPAHVDVMPLYGDLAGAQQDAAIQPSPAGRRKVVLATSIAESSLTIEGVRVVIDSGFMRQPRFSPRSGMSRLETVRVSQASAEQRQGRAGRVAPGLCYRLWAEAAHGGLAKFTAPEIAVADLAPLALDLAAWGARDAEALPWLDPPPAATLTQARRLLHDLGALDADNTITAHGRAMADLPLHPRLAHMVIRGQAKGQGALACALAALLSERDIAKSEAPRRGVLSPRDADLRWRLEMVLGNDRRPAPHGLRVDANALRMVKQLAEDWRRRLKAPKHGGDAEAAGILAALAYPDRVAKKRGQAAGSYVMSGGRGAKLDELDPLCRETYLAIAELDGAQADARVFLAAPVSEAEIEAELGEAITTQESVVWDEREQAVLARRQRRLGALVLKDRALDKPPADLVRAALLDGIAKAGLEVLPWSEGLRQWQARVLLLRRLLPEAADWPDVSDAGLAANLADWLGPHLDGKSKLSHLGNLDLTAILKGLLNFKQGRLLEAEAPTHWRVPTGNSLPIDYTSGDTPVLAVRLQEMFGERNTPAIAGGRMKLLLHLLSPARRPLQVTSDLAGFWQSSYRAVRAEMRGQYPKHPWPEDPANATPTSRAKPRN